MAPPPLPGWGPLGGHHRRQLHAGHGGGGLLRPADRQGPFRHVRPGRGGLLGHRDLFASVLLGGLLRDETLADATARAVDFVQKAISRTLAAGTPILDGVQFEGLLRELL